MKILVDFNSLAIRTLYIPQIGGSTGTVAWDLWHYRMFDTLYHFLLSEADRDGSAEMVLAVDGGDYWRKEKYPLYKADRKKDDKLDWEEVKRNFNLFLSRVRSFLPWTILQVYGCEADDVIAVLTETFPREEKVVIHSSDIDYVQLMDRDTVRVFRPKTGYLEFPLTVKNNGKELTYETVQEFLECAILTGQGGKDNVCNVRTPLDWHETHPGKRRPPLGVVAAKKIFSEGVASWLEKNGAEERYALNKELIDFREIPQEIQARILEAYTDYDIPELDVAGFMLEYGWPSYEDISVVEMVLAGMHRDILQEITEESDGRIVA